MLLRGENLMKKLMTLTAVGLGLLSLTLVGYSDTPQFTNCLTGAPYHWTKDAQGFTLTPPSPETSYTCFLISSTPQCDWKPEDDKSDLDQAILTCLKNAGFSNCTINLDNKTKLKYTQCNSTSTT